ncbi:HAMP domain-containing sensor histidine kinase [Bacillus sp. AFS002410]|uniref:HAMP domain-containing sensor histidine kinase n=1 Tax=Bacillus sp. AFS002410 TaxID=2033481 RepID=UPI00211D2430|nr:HAMP domain-containing sensor histidine kinase [Bacillus sp. AFS002410]
MVNIKFRTKMIFLVCISMLISGLISSIFYRFLQLYYINNATFGSTLAQIRQLIRNIGDIYFILIIFFIIAIIIFYFLIKPYDSYFKEISRGIHLLATGDFTGRVHISSNDEFKLIAKDMNMASEKLKQAIERGEFAESSKDQLVLNLAHDLRTPLTSVLGYLDFILQDDQLTEEQVKHFTSIAFKKSQRLEQLINELFEVTRMNYGMLPLDYKTIDLSKLLIQLIEELYPVFANNELIARTNIISKLEMVADGALLARVFENLLMNAARYGSDGQYVDINCLIENEIAVVQVINYGDHIPPEDLPNIFEMFYTGDKSRTGQEDSTGLGLFISKNIVEQHKGTISVESSLIRTIFEVRMPISNET